MIQQQPATRVTLSDGQIALIRSAIRLLRSLTRVLEDVVREFGPKA